MTAQPTSPLVLDRLGLWLTTIQGLSEFGGDRHLQARLAAPRNWSVPRGRQPPSVNSGLPEMSQAPGLPASASGHQYPRSQSSTRKLQEYKNRPQLLGS